MHKPEDWPAQADEHRGFLFCTPRPESWWSPRHVSQYLAVPRSTARRRSEWYWTGCRPKASLHKGERERWGAFFSINNYHSISAVTPLLRARRGDREKEKSGGWGGGRAITLWYFPLACNELYVIWSIQSSVYLACGKRGIKERSNTSGRERGRRCGSERGAGGRTKVLRDFPLPLNEVYAIWTNCKNRGIKENGNTSGREREKRGRKSGVGVGGAGTVLW